MTTTSNGGSFNEAVTTRNYDKVYRQDAVYEANSAMSLWIGKKERGLKFAQEESLKRQCVVIFRQDWNDHVIAIFVNGVKVYEGDV